MLSNARTSQPRRARKKKKEEAACLPRLRAVLHEGVLLLVERHLLGLRQALVLLGLVEVPRAERKVHVRPEIENSKIKIAKSKLPLKLAN